MFTSKNIFNEIKKTFFKQINKRKKLFQTKRKVRKS